MRIVVTGATGFLGSWVCRVLSQNHAVTALIRNESSAKRLGGINGIRVIDSPVDSWHREINSMSADVFISMDWWGVEGSERNDPRQSSNVERTTNLLGKLDPIPVIIGTGSQAELGPVSELISEDRPDAPTTEYGRCKVQARSLFQQYSIKTGARFAWARIFSTYGPLDSSDWLIPATMNSLSQGKEMALTPGEQEWSYLHAFDLAEAFRTIVEIESLSGAINVGNPQTVKIREVTGSIAQLVGNSELLKYGAIPYREDQVMRLAPLCESLTSVGWRPQVSLEEGLRHLYNWLILKKNTKLALVDGNSKEFNLPLLI